MRQHAAQPGPVAEWHHAGRLTALAVAGLIARHASQASSRLPQRAASVPEAAVAAQVAR